MFKELNDDMTRRAQRAELTGDKAAGRILAQLTEVATQTSLLANTTKPGMRPTHAKSLVTAAIRAQRQTMLNLAVATDSDDAVVETAGALFDGCDALCVLAYEAGILMEVIAQGNNPTDPAINRLREALDDFDAWAVSQATTEVVGDAPVTGVSVSSCEEEGEAEEHWCGPCRYGYSGDCEVFGATAKR